MLSLEDEVATLRGRGVLDERTAARLIAIERGELFPIGGELRAVAYIAVAMIVTGVGIFITKNFERIGLIAIIVTLAIAAAACYAPAIRAKLRNEERTAVGEFVLLLGALLIAADIGFAESRFHPLGDFWTLHLLLIAVLHAAGAYAFGSRLLLSAALAALTSWFGFQMDVLRVFDRGGVNVGVAGLAAAATILIWRLINSRYARFASFAGTFDFFIANVALYASVVLVADDDTRAIGMLLTTAFVAASMVHGIRTRAISFVVYGVVYGVIAILIAVAATNNVTLFFFALLLSAVGGALILYFVRQSMREAR